METIIVHPENYEYFSKSFDNKYYPFEGYDYFFGIDIKVDLNVPKYGRKWQFPNTRFVEYEKSDEVWARPVRFGKEVDDTNNRICYMINEIDYFKPIKMKFEIPEFYKGFKCFP